ncbi:MAG TPA: ABC transporter ATP-binding protein [Candidatus Dormibacteraeota bacterium]
MIRRAMVVMPSPGDQKIDWRRFPRLLLGSFRIVNAAAPREFKVSLALQLVQGVSMGIQLLVIRNLLEAVLHGTGRSFTPVLTQVGLLVGLQAAQSLIGTYQTMQQAIVQELVQRHASRPVSEVATTMPLKDFDTPQFHDRMQRAQQTAIMRPIQITNAVVTIGRTLLGVAGLAIGLLILSPLLLAISLLGFVPLWLATTRISRAVYEFMRDTTENDRKRNYVLGLLTSRDMAKEVRAFALGGYFRDVYERLSDERLVRLRRHLRQRAALSFAGALATAAASGVTFGVLAWLITSGHLGLAAAGAAATASLQLGSQLQQMASAAGQLYESALFIDDLNAFLALRPEIERLRPKAPAPAGFARIELRDVEFTYPVAPASKQPAPLGRHRGPGFWMLMAGFGQSGGMADGGDGHQRPHALRGVSMEIRRGEVIALVGENGSGKTTLAKLICGLYAPDQGSVTWDGIDTSTVDPDQLRDQVTVIFQDFVRYMLTARENIGVGRAANIDDLEAIRTAAGHAGAADFIERWPEAYESMLGPIFEGGKDLSIGQWQRIALARAFFRDAPLIILDEPTASLDARAEAELFSRIRSLFAGRTVLLISHRFSSVRSADRIYVLRAGEVVERGTHEQLLEADGLYAELFNLQAAAYLDGGGPTARRPRAGAEG